MADEVNTIDELMSLDPLSLTTANLDSIIAHHRKGRANAAAGIKAKRDSGPKADISEALKGMFSGEIAPKPAVVVRRR